MSRKSLPAVVLLASLAWAASGLLASAQVRPGTQRPTRPPKPPAVQRPASGGEQPSNETPGGSSGAFEGPSGGHTGGGCQGPTGGGAGDPGSGPAGGSTGGGQGGNRPPGGGGAGPGNRPSPTTFSNPVGVPGGSTPPARPGPGPAGPAPRPVPGGGDPGEGRRPVPPIPGRMTPAGLPFERSRWENWWLLNQDRHLDVDRRYTARSVVREVSSDAFLGARVVPDPAEPVALHRRLARRKLVPVLRDQLGNAHSLIRGEAALALGKVGSQDVVPFLRPLMSDSNSFVRQMALLGLGLTDSEQATPHVAGFLVHQENQDVDRAMAALALGLLGDPVALPALSSVVDEPGRTRKVTAAALYAMGFIPGDEALLLLGDFLERRGTQGDLRAVAVLALGKHRRTSQIPRLMAFLGDAETPVRRSAALALGSQRFVSDLWKRRDEDLEKLETWTRNGVLTPAARRAFEAHLAELEMRAAKESRRLQKLHDAVVAALARTLRDDSDPMVRNFAAIALGRIGTQPARRALEVEFQRSGSHSTQGFLALALGISTAREAIPLLRHQLLRERTDPSTRSAVSLALGLLDDRASGRVLLDLALGHTNTVRAFAAVACGLMNLDAAKKPFRAELLDDAQAFLRPDFGLALGLLGDHQATRELKRLLLQGPSGNTRIQAAQALGRIRDVTSVDVLLEALQLPRLTDLARAHIIHAMGEVSEKGRLPGLEPLARDWNYLLPFPVINEALLR